MASRIHLFRYAQKLHQQMGIYLTESNEPAPFNFRNFLVLFFYWQMFAPSFLFFVFKATTFRDYADCFYAFITTISCSGYFVVQMSQITNFVSLTKQYEGFIEQMNTRMHYYIKLNETIELATKILHWSSYLTVIGVICPQFFLSYTNFYIFDLGKESFYLPFPNLLPFDWKTPFGFLVTVLSQAASVFCVVYNVAPFVAFMFGSCMLIIGFLEDIASEFTVLAAPSGSMKKTPTHMKWRFCRIIKLYSDVKQFAGQFNGIYEFLVFITVAWCLVTISCDFLLLQSELSSITDPNAKLIDVITAIQTLSLFFWSFFLIAFFCLIGEMLANQFNQFHEQLCQSNWYLYPMEIKQLYLLFIADTQHPSVIAGYGNILCTRGTFKATINTGFSYFMLIRQMKD